MANVADFYDQLFADIRQSPIVKHPFLKRFGKAAFDKAQVKEFGLQYYHYSSQFYRFMAYLCAIVPDEATREPLILNLYQGGGENNLEATHPALFRRFLRALGTTDQEIAEHRPIPEVSLFIDRYYKLVKEGHYLEALGAIGPATECIVPEIYSQMVPNFKKLGLSDDDIVFFPAHIELDQEHGDNMLEVMRPLSSSNAAQALIRSGVEGVIESRKVLWDGLLGHLAG